MHARFTVNFEHKCHQNVHRIRLHTRQILTEDYYLQVSQRQITKAVMSLKSVDQGLDSLNTSKSLIAAPKVLLINPVGY